MVLYDGRLDLYKYQQDLEQKMAAKQAYYQLQQMQQQPELGKPLFTTSLVTEENMGDKKLLLLEEEGL